MYNIKRAMSASSLETLSPKRLRFENEVMKISDDKFKGLFTKTPHTKHTEETTSNRHPHHPDELIYQTIAQDGHCLYNAVGIYLGETQKPLRSAVATYR